MKVKHLTAILNSLDGEKEIIMATDSSGEEFKIIDGVYMAGTFQVRGYDGYIIWPDDSVVDEDYFLKVEDKPTKKDYAGLEDDGDY